MSAAGYLLSGVVAVIAGLDRTAAVQLMLSRPIVVAPLTGWLLGNPLVGLQVGALLELLWLGRLPVGAAIPPDDTQVAIASTVLSLSMADRLPLDGLPLLLLCTLVAIPLGKVGQLADRLVRQRNGRLLERAQAALAVGDLRLAERCHLRGLVHFAVGALLSFMAIVAAGSVVLHWLAPLLAGTLPTAAERLRVALPLVGVAMILGTINVSRVRTLFGASFVTALLMLWLL